MAIYVSLWRSDCWRRPPAGCAQALPAAVRGADDAELLQLAEKENWRRCPKCGHLVERTEGCSFIVCKCRWGTGGRGVVMVVEGWGRAALGQAIRMGMARQVGSTVWVAGVASQLAVAWRGAEGQARMWRHSCARLDCKALWYQAPGI